MKETLNLDHTIITKVHELFDYRMIPDMLDSCQLNADGFLDELYHLQYVIFELDQYLEQNWDLDEMVLNSKWKQIEKILDPFHAKKTVQKLLSQLKIYELHEMNLRCGGRPEKVDIRYFYYYKSCDVKLMRNLILDKALKNEILPNFNAFDWLVYDWVTEVNDDISDLEEDRLTNNCNRYMFALEISKVNAQIEYRDFLDYLEKKALQLMLESSSSMKSDIYNHTISEIEKTKEMLNLI